MKKKPLDLRRFAQLERVVQQKRREYDTAKGSLEQLAKLIQAETGVGTLKLGIQKRNELQKKIEKLEAEIERQLSQIEHRFGGFLNGRN